MFDELRLLLSFLIMEWSTACKIKSCPCIRWFLIPSRDYIFTCIHINVMSREATLLFSIAFSKVDCRYECNLLAAFNNSS